MAVSCLKHSKKRAKLTEFKKQEANFSGASSHFSSSLTNLLSRKTKKNVQLKHHTAAVLCSGAIDSAVQGGSNF